MLRLSEPAMGPPTRSPMKPAAVAPWPSRRVSGRSGLSQTDPTGCQFRVRPDQRAGCFSFVA